MSFSIIDRRKNGKGKSLENRQKFLKRIRHSIKKALPDIINNRKLKDVNSEGGIIHIPQKNIKEPSFRHGEGGIRESVRPGNKEFNPGDRFRKPPSGGQGAGGKKGSNEGSGEDDFTVEISRDEFLDYLFEDLELPDMVKKDLKEIKTEKWHNAGFSTTGSPAKLDTERSLRNSFARRIGQRAPYKKRIRDAEARIVEIDTLLSASMLGQKDYDENANAVLRAEKAELEKKIAGWKAKAENFPFLDPLDLRYRSSVQETVKTSHAVMFCIMDNSGSMGEREKLLSKKFFVLLYLFLERKYETVDIRFIYHTTEAKEVDEETFFNNRESGGTVISSALELVDQIIKADYASDVSNLYVCQCSDGDNWAGDNGTCYELLVDDIMPKVQYYAYLQIDPEGTTNYTSDIWASYESVAQEFESFQMTRVQEESAIYSVFRELFEKK